MIEFLVGLAAGAACLVPGVLAERHLRKQAERGWDLESARTEKAAERIDRLTTKLEARTFNESLSVSALLDRPDPEPDVAGRWLHSDDGLVSEFVPD